MFQHIVVPEAPSDSVSRDDLETRDTPTTDGVRSDLHSTPFLLIKKVV